MTISDDELQAAQEDLDAGRVYFRTRESRQLENDLTAIVGIAQERTNPGSRTAREIDERAGRLLNALRYVISPSDAKAILKEGDYPEGNLPLYSRLSYLAERDSE